MNYKNYGTFKSLAGKNNPSFALKDILSQRIFVSKVLNPYIGLICDSRKDDLIVDLGCGSGKFLQKLHALGYTNLLGVDKSDSYNHVSEVDIVCGDIDEFLDTLKDSFVSIFLMLDIIEHIEKERIETTIKKMFRKLTPGNGKLIIRCPNLASPFSLINQFGDLTHLTGHNQNSLQQLAFNCDIISYKIMPDFRRAPYSLKGFLGCLIGPIVFWLLSCIFASYRIRRVIMTPNILFTAHRI